MSLPPCVCARARAHGHREQDQFYERAVKMPYSYFANDYRHVYGHPQQQATVDAAQVGERSFSKVLYIVSLYGKHTIDMGNILGNSTDLAGFARRCAVAGGGTALQTRKACRTTEPFLQTSGRCTRSNRTFLRCGAKR